MRICIFGNPTNLFIKRWANLYVSQNHEVHIIHLEQLSKKSEQISTNGYKIHKVRFLTFFLLDLQLIFTLIQLLRLLKKIKPDILHIFYITYNAWLAALSGFHPLILTAYGSDIYVEAKNIKRNRNWVSYAIQKADLITTTSKTMKKYIIKEFNTNPEKISSFYWGQNLKIFKSGYEKEVAKLRKQLKLDEDTYVILSNRNMTSIHGIQYIVEAIPFVIKKRNNVKFIFLRGTGKVDFEKRIKARVKELNIEKYAIFITKYLTQEELAVLNNLSNVIISLPGSDQFSGAVKESMACGVIPIVNDLEVYHEHIVDGKNGFFVNRENPNEVAKKIIYCIDNHPELKEKFAKINRKILEEKSDWHKNSKIMLKLYEKLQRK